MVANDLRRPPFGAPSADVLGTGTSDRVGGSVEKSQESPKKGTEMRVIITGGPKTGKTTRAAKTGQRVDHTDSIIATQQPWSVQEGLVLPWLDRPGPWLIEGVTAVRALRSWMRAHPGQRPPVDKVIYLSQPKVGRTLAQERMAKGLDTVWREIEQQVRTFGIEVET